MSDVQLKDECLLATWAPTMAFTNKDMMVVQTIITLAPMHSVKQTLCFCSGMIIVTTGHSSSFSWVKRLEQPICLLSFLRIIW